jgi:hypothetical protein
MTSTTFGRPFPSPRVPQAGLNGRPGRAVAAGQAIARKVKTNWVAVFLFLAIVTPPAVTLPMQSPKVTATRAVLLVFLIPAVLTLLKGVSSGKRRLRFSDFFMVATGLWMFSAFVVTEGLPVAAVSANLVILELVGGYLLARAFFATRQDLDAAVRALRTAVLITIGVALFDHAMGQNWVNDSFARLFHVAPIETQYRNGVLRAMSTTEHAILFGSFCVLSAGVLYFGRTSGKSGLRRLMMCGLGCVLAMSSAPLLALMVLFAVIIYDKVLNRFAWRWKLFAFGLVSFVVFLCIFSNSPIEALLRRLTLEPQTAFYRLLIWEYAGAEVLNSPWVGIGFRDWARIPGMTGSVDSLWLVTAMTFGIPASILLGLTLISATWKSGRRVPSQARDPYLEQFRSGLTIVLMLAIFIGFTVHLWGAMMTFLGVIIGMRTTIEEIRSNRAGARAEPERALHRTPWPAEAGLVPAMPRAVPMPRRAGPPMGNSRD